MKAFLHIFFIACIILLLFLVYGAWRKAFGRRSYDTVKRSPLSQFTFIFWPKTLPNFIKAYKFLILFMLFLMVALYVVYITTS